MAKEMNLWMSSKAEAGTCIDYIGGRHLITGGFGTLAPHKRARCFELCGAALDDQLDLDEFGAHNSFLVHVRDILDFDVRPPRGKLVPPPRTTPRLGDSQTLRSTLPAGASRTSR